MPDTLDHVVRIAALPILLIFLFNGFDDLFVDLNYYLRGLWRDRNRLTPEQLKAVPQKRIAMLVPAWREADVIEQMLENTLASIDYDPNRIDLFVGTYANDPETQAKVDSVAARVPNVIKVVVPHDGPTCKADCLNWVYQGILLAEERRNERYGILVLHDSEDVIHPLEMRLFNYYIPAYDFVQTPVLPLEVGWSSFIGGTYLDDFTENHLKDMIVRARLGGLVPSAGVGSAFARDAFEQIALANSQEIFDPKSLTEDYEIGIKFRLANKKTLFACEPIVRTREVTDKRGRKWTVARNEYIATREFFPTAFTATVRQRSRWILGINFQAWAKVGWQGPPAVLYCLWRDRKAALSHITSAAGYLVFIYALARLAVGALTGHPWSFAYLFPIGSFLWWGILINTLFLLWRWTVRFMTVEKVYGPFQGFMSVVRLPLGNIVNFGALARATWQWIDHKISGKPLRWASTAHTFPTTAALATYHRRLGDILVDREGLSRADLARSLELQKRAKEPLGEILAASGALEPSQVMRGLGAQWSIPVMSLDPAAIPLSLLERFPESEAERLEILPIGVEEGVALVAVARPLSSLAKEDVESQLGMRVRIGCASRVEIRHARERAYRRLAGMDRSRRLGETLVSRGLVSPDTLWNATRAQLLTGEPLGEFLLRTKTVSPKQLSLAMQESLGTAFVSVRPDEGDVSALHELGFGLCAMHSLVPVRSGGVVSAFPLGADARRRVEERLGRPVPGMIGPRADVLLALRTAALSAWPRGIIAGAGGSDGAELAASRAYCSLTDQQLARAVFDAMERATAPLDYLTRTGALDVRHYNATLARAYGLAEDRGNSDGPASTLLPRSIVEKFALRVVAASPSSITISWPRPRPEAGRRIAALVPDRAITWLVSPSGSDERGTQGHESESISPAA